MISEVNSKKLEKFGIKESSNPFRKFFIYELNNEIIGYLIVDILYERLEIIDVFVIPEERNKKVASNMIKYLIDFAKKISSINITLEVNEQNVYAIKLYEKYGFKNVARREKYYNDKDGILMELIL